uniref:ACAS_N domain-containing protein n=1 Tax=Globodera pallida TaxID=36090 RepID=A0A183CAS8_GLOPA
MLACARIGAIHSVVFAGFSADSLAQRIVHAHARLLVTADGCGHGNTPIQQEMYRRSVNNDPDKFGRCVAEQLHFEQFSERGLEWNFDHRKGDVFVRFMAGARTKIAYNCLERNIRAGLGDRAASRWEATSTSDGWLHRLARQCAVSYPEATCSDGVRSSDSSCAGYPLAFCDGVCKCREGALNAVAKFMCKKRHMLVRPPQTLERHANTYQQCSAEEPGAFCLQLTCWCVYSMQVSQDGHTCTFSGSELHETRRNLDSRNWPMSPSGLARSLSRCRCPNNQVFSGTRCMPAHMPAVVYSQPIRIVLAGLRANQIEVQGDVFVRFMAGARTNIAPKPAQSACGPGCHTLCRDGVNMPCTTLNDGNGGTTPPATQWHTDFDSSTMDEMSRVELAEFCRGFAQDIPRAILRHIPAESCVRHLGVQTPALFF